MASTPSTRRQHDGVWWCGLSPLDSANTVAFAEKRVPDSLVDLRAGRDPFSSEKTAAAARVVAYSWFIYASGIARQVHQGDRGCPEEAIAAAQDAAPKAADPAADATTRPPREGA